MIIKRRLMVLFHVYNIGNKYYLYDVHSGNIVSIDTNVYQVLEDIELSKTKTSFYSNGTKNIIKKA